VSAYEKVARYLQERKKLVEAKTIATHFLMAKSSITRALQRLESDNKAVRLRIAKTVYWAWKREEAQPVAVPRATTYVQPSQPTPINRPPPAKTSYPHIRGYED
jgi:predicted transcriptional regulator